MSSSESEIELHPSKKCDIVMKGGITSGLVYPKAIFEIAKKYQFKNIGGTSAGAIAAGLTAAAEYRRSKGSSEGFDILKTLPEMLSEKSGDKTLLLDLFSPNQSTKKYFNILFPLLNRKGKCSMILKVIITLLKSYPIVTIALLSVYILLEILFFDPSLFCHIIYTSINVLTFLILASCGNASLFLYKLNKELKKNNFGLTTGYGHDYKKKNAIGTSLTMWLSELLDKVAGKETPLVFGDLYDYKTGSGIDLKMVTTNLNFGIPKTLPFVRKREKDKWTYFFKESDMKMYFPKKVIDWMIDKSEERFNEFHALPDASNLPIIVAVRMSLSFPVLISAVPLYIRDYQNEDSGDNPIFKKSWFSDGGICSNFPIHFFDSPLPTHPTFAINLKPFKKGESPDQDQSKNIFIPENNNEGLEYEWNYNDSSVIGFLTSILSTMQNWNDNALMRVPGYRDRICHIYLSNKEGGMNLNMSEEFIDNMSKRGSFAGIELRRRFSESGYSKMNWENHKWIRFRSTISLLEKFLIDMKNAYENDNSIGGASYKDMITRGKDEAPLSYKLSNENQKQFITNKLDELFLLLNQFDLESRDKTFSGDTVPRPIPDLKIRPKY